MTIVPQNRVFDLPWPCPVCKSKVSAMVNAWSEDDQGRWIASEIETTCESEPPLPDNDEDEPAIWDDWFDSHYAAPYLDWLPYNDRALIWINKSYRFSDSEKGGA